MLHAKQGHTKTRKPTFTRKNTAILYYINIYRWCKQIIELPSNCHIAGAERTYVWVHPHKCKRRGNTPNKRTSTITWAVLRILLILWMEIVDGIGHYVLGIHRLLRFVEEKQAHTKQWVSECNLYIFNKKGDILCWMYYLQAARDRLHRHGSTMDVSHAALGVHLFCVWQHKWPLILWKQNGTPKFHHCADLISNQLSKWCSVLLFGLTHLLRKLTHRKGKTHIPDMGKRNAKRWRQTAFPSRWKSSDNPPTRYQPMLLLRYCPLSARSPQPSPKSPSPHLEMSIDMQANIVYWHRFDKYAVSG